MSAVTPRLPLLAEQDRAQPIESDRKEENDARRDLLVEGWDLQQRHAIRDRPQHEHADDRPGNASHAARERRTAEDDRGDRGERCLRSDGGRAGQQLARHDDPRKGGERAADRVHERRHEIEKEHETYIRGFLWTMSNNPRVPEAIRKRTAAYGLAKDEFADNGGWPWMIYIREARRMVGDYVMTQHDCEGKRAAPDPVALGSFGMDSHVVQHFVTESGHVNSEGVIWRVPPKPYGISYRSIIPRKGECENLFSPICVSASHVAHGSIRMEPVFMALAQSAAVAAGVAIDQKVSVQDVSYEALREKLEAAKQIVRTETWKRASAAEKPTPPKAGRVRTNR